MTAPLYICPIVTWEPILQLLTGIVALVWCGKENLATCLIGMGLLRVWMTILRIRRGGPWDSYQMNPAQTGLCILLRAEGVMDGSGLDILVANRPAITHTTSMLAL